MVRIKGLNKTFNTGKPAQFQALKDIDLNILQGSMTVLVGPSGSGKTTLLSIIGCMTRPTSGRIWLNGRETTSLPERFATETRRKSFGFIFQNYNLIRGLSVIENVLLPTYPTGVRHSKIKERAMQLLKELDLKEKKDQKVQLLSGGEQQRTAIARALINDPSVVIADEPTAHLDSVLADRLINILVQLKDDGKTVLIASHDPLVFESFAVNHLVSMRDGVITNEEKRL